MLSRLIFYNNLIFPDRGIIRGRIRIQCTVWNHDWSYGRHIRKEKDGAKLLYHLFFLLSNQIKLAILYVTDRKTFWWNFNLHVVLHFWVLVCIRAYRTTRISIRMDRNHIFHRHIMEWYVFEIWHEKYGFAIRFLSGLQIIICYF